MDIFLVVALLSFAILIVAWMLLPNSTVVSATEEQPAALIGEAHAVKS